MELKNVFSHENKKNLLITSFGAIGSLGLTLSVSSSFSFFLAFSIPFLVSEGLTYARFRNNNFNPILGGFLEKQYGKALNSWFNDYISTSENNTEKKYKAFFTAMWLSTRKTNIFNMIDLGSSPYNVLSKALIENKETKYNMIDLFRSEYNTQSVEFDDIIKEDLNNSDKLKIARKVYKDFEDLGMLGDNIQHWNFGIARSLFVIQDFTFTKKDIEIIEEKITQLNNTKNTDEFQVSTEINKLFFLDTFSIYSIESILENEKNEKHLNALKNYFMALKNNENERYAKYADLIDGYMKMDKLDNQLEIKSYSKKVNKI